MKRRVSIVILAMLLCWAGVTVVHAKPPTGGILEITITTPEDGLTIDSEVSFEVSGTVVAKRWDCGLVETYVQYAIGEGSTDFSAVAGTSIWIVSGGQPQTASLLKNEQYAVSWMLAGESGTYEIRIFSDSENAEAGWSESRTVVIGESPPPPPTPPSDIETADAEYQDPDIGFGSASGTYADTFVEDGVYEILSEEKNSQGTKKPVDDTSELGWVFEFNNLPLREETTLHVVGYGESTQDDTDTAFNVQMDYEGSWITLIRIENNRPTKEYTFDISDDSSNTIKIRFTDNDFTIGDKELAKLYLDQLFISNHSIPTTPGIEILFPPYSCSHFKVYEYDGNSWYHDVDYPILAGAATDTEIADLDLDGNNEVVVAEGIYEPYGRGIIEIFDFDIGIDPIETIVVPEEFSEAVYSIEVFNADDDPYPEILGGLSMHAAVMWDYVNGEYIPAQIFRDDGALDKIAAGNFDYDEEYEFVITVAYDDLQPILAIYDFDGNSWVNLANYSGFTPGEYFGRVETCDYNFDGVDEIVVSFHDEPIRLLSYEGGRIICTWESSFVYSSYSFATGNITNDGLLDLLLYIPDPEYKLYYMEYQNGVFVHTLNVSVPGMERIFREQIKVGDIDLDGLNEFVIGEGPGGIYSVGHLWIFRYDVLLYDTPVDGNDANDIEIGDYDNDIGN